MIVVTEIMMRLTVTANTMAALTEDLNHVTVKTETEVTNAPRRDRMRLEAQEASPLRPKSIIFLERLRPCEKLFMRPSCLNKNSNKPARNKP